MQYRCKQSKPLSVLEGLLRVRSLVLWSAFFALCVPPSLAQSRPVLLNPKRDYYAGRVVLIPASAEPDAAGTPRQLAQIADHELRTPPIALLGDDQLGALNRWVNEYDFAETDGLLVAVDKLGEQATATLQNLRKRYRHLSIFGFGQSPVTLELLTAGTLDFLLFTGSTTTEVTLPAQRAAYLAAFSEGSAHASSVVLVRWLNQRFGYAPQFQFILSSSQGKALTGAVVRTVAALGASSVADKTADLRVIVHAPQTTEEERMATVNAIATLTSNGARVALFDANENAEARSALLKAVRERKLLDRLAAYAAVNTHAPSAEVACQRVLAQANLWLIALRFLRDDIERIRRTERNQIGALLSAYLREVVYPTLALEPSGTLIEREASLQAALRPQAEAIFDEQFKRNVHAVLLNTGERIEFELRLLQRLQVRLAETTKAAEIRADVNLVLLDSFLIPKDFPRANWELSNADSLDSRIINRFNAISWVSFKMDVPNATIMIKLSNKAAANDMNTDAAAQGYSLNSRRSGDTRRFNLNAATTQGAFYALAHLEHLGANGQLAQDFQFTEKPALAQRGFAENSATPWSHRERLEMLRLAGRARLNVIVLSSQERNTSRARELSETARANFVTLTYAPLSPSQRLAQQPCESSPLGAFVLDVPALNGNNGAVACASPVAARLARLPLAWFGAYGWSGASLPRLTALSVTVNWLYEGKAREAMQQWLQAFTPNAPASFAPLFDETVAEINVPLLSEKLNQLQATLSQFDTTREHGLLRGALRAFLQDAQQRLLALAENPRYERTESGAYRRRNP